MKQKNEVEDKFSFIFLYTLEAQCYTIDDPPNRGYKKKEGIMMKKVEYKVTGMTCGGCASSVSRVISRNKGVSEVDVKQMENTVFVTYDEALVNDELIISQITRLGFQAEVK